MPMTVYQAEWCPFSRKLRQRLTELGLEWCAPPVEADPPDRDEEIIAALDDRFDEPPTAEGHKLAAAMH
jgi:glutaredoxin